MTNEFLRFKADNVTLDLNSEISVFNGTGFISKITMRQYSKIIEKHYDICLSNDKPDMKLLRLTGDWETICPLIAKALFEEAYRPNLHKGLETFTYDSLKTKLYG